MKKISICFFLIVLASFTAFGQKQTFGIQGENFTLNGKPFIIRSGEMHYPRVSREYWRDRFKKAKALGLNTITTYVFWNLHEPSPGKFDFSGNLDIAEFVRQAKEEGLLVIVRPGPYVCTEWDFGGIPAWFLREKDIKVRTNDARFMSATDVYIKKVGEQLAPLQITNGGNIIMVQVENEYGSFGEDKEYMSAVKRSIQNAGFNVTLFTSDGSQENMLKNGTLPETASVINFSANDSIEKEFANYAKFRTNVPKMIGEYWVGWFDNWGSKHHTVAPEVVAKGIDYALSKNISFNLYMFHGGTSFGYMPGANYSKNAPYTPDTTSYDYDSPLDEAGRPTAKFYAVRDVIKKYLPSGEALAEISETTKFIEIPRFDLTETAELKDLMKTSIKSQTPRTMEDLGQNYGFVLYRKKIESDAKGKLEITKLHDYAVLYKNQAAFGKIDRRLNENSFDIDVKKGETLDVLVENMGRLNFGKEFIFDRKGITEKVVLNNEELKNWEIFSLPLDNLSNLKFSKKTKINAVFHRGNFNIAEIGDTFLDMRGWSKGHVWINGHHLGRFWEIGPQMSLYIPASWLKKGKNEVIILDVGTPRQKSLQSVKNQIFESRK